MTDTKTTLKAAPGIYLIRLIEDQTKVTLGENVGQKQILKGRIIDVGRNRQHDDGGEMVATFKVNDVVFFFSYVAGADFFEHEGEKYYTVLFNDCRAFIAG